MPAGRSKDAPILLRLIVIRERDGASNIFGYTPQRGRGAELPSHWTCLQPLLPVYVLGIPCESDKLYLPDWCNGHKTTWVSLRLPNIQTHLKFP